MAKVFGLQEWCESFTKAGKINKSAGNGGVGPKTWEGGFFLSQSQAGPVKEKAYMYY